MGKKHKKHKKHHTDHGSFSSLPVYGSPSAVDHSAAESYRVTQDQEMRVVVRLPQPMVSQPERVHHSPSVGRHDRSTEAPVVSELKVSIPFTKLHQETHEDVEEASTSEHRHHHKHKKHHKKHKKHHHQPATMGSDAAELSLPPIGKPVSHPSSKHTSFHQESPPTVAPIKLKVPKSVSTGTVESHRPTLQQQQLSAAQFQPMQQQTPVLGGVKTHSHMQPSQVHKHHKHHKHHHHHHKKSHTVTDLPEPRQQEVGDIARPVPTGKPRAHIYHHSLEGSSTKMVQSTSLVEDEHKPTDQESSEASGHKHHHKKKKKKHKHSKSGHHHSPGQTQPAFPVPPQPFAQHQERKPLEPSKPLVPALEGPPKRDSGDTAVVSRHSKPPLDEGPPPTKKVRIEEPMVGLKTVSPRTPKSSGVFGVSSELTPPTKRKILTTKAQYTPPTKAQPVKVEMPKPLKKSHPSPKDVSSAESQPPPTVAAGPPAPPPHIPVPETRGPQVKLSKSALKFFLKNLHHLIHKRDTEGIFAEPVTDDIAPGYSLKISNPMDLSTVATKIESDQYTSINEFKSDFVLMCNNAMTYNAPETVYYSAAKRLLTTGLKSIAKETSLRPDILHGSTRAESASPLPPTLQDYHLPAPTDHQLNYNSPFLCRLNITPLRSSQKVPTSGMNIPAVVDQPDFINIDLSDFSEISDQSHLTKVVVGCEEERNGGGIARESAEEILMQVEEVAETCKENLDANKPNVRFCFLNQNDEGKTMINFMNPDSRDIDSSKPVDLTTLSDHVRMGNNAATVLKTELPMMKATPVSYLMYGPFGSFAPTYDSTFATLSKMDSDLLLHTYGNELGVSYAHSLQQFVKGTGSFVSEMADAVLNGLTSGRHSKFMDKIKSAEEKEQREENTQQDLRSSKETTPSKDGSPPVSEEGSPKEEPMQYSKSEESKVEEGEGEKMQPAAQESRGDSMEDMDSDEKTEQSSRQSSVTPSEGGSSMGPGSNVESGRGSPVSLEGSEEFSREGSIMKDSEASILSDQKTEAVPPIEPEDTDIDAHLQHTTNLLSELQEQQNDRLSLPPVKNDEGHLVLPGPSQEEMDTAQDVRTELATLTAQVQPKDIVSVPTLHRAMGITIEPQENDKKDDPSSKPSGV